jgi:hypothetical protein
MWDMDNNRKNQEESSKKKDDEENKQKDTFSAVFDESIEFPVSGENPRPDEPNPTPKREHNPETN